MLTFWSMHILYLSLIKFFFFSVTARTRDYNEKIEERSCRLLTHYGSKRFQVPRSIAIGPNDQIIVVDRDNHECVILDDNMNVMKVFGKLNCAEGVAVSHSVIAISDSKDHIVKKFTLQGGFLSKFGSYGTRNGEFKNPQGLCFNIRGFLYVVDCKNFRVQVFDQKNKFNFKFGSRKELMDPHYIALDSSNQAYVTDFDGCGIVVYSESGHFITKISSQKTWAICIAPDDYILVDDDDDRINVFSPSYQLITRIGSRGIGKGHFGDMRTIAINRAGMIFVAECNNMRLQCIA